MQSVAGDCKIRCPEERSYLKSARIRIRSAVDKDVFLPYVVPVRGIIISHELGRTGASMIVWFLLAGNNPDELHKVFADFYSVRENPRGIALWKWKKTCWICSPENAKQEILAAFARFGAVEFSSAPSPSDLEFLHGDNNALAVPS